MGLTRIRAEQISDIDYKQAVRVLELTNVNLSGGAPAVVDGVSLNTGDRILVAGQNTNNQNGLYDVVAPGTGSNGTWTRTSDANATGEINAGMIVMVTEGSTYADTSWKLITNDPIVIGTTGLVFAQNTGNGFGVINANGTPVVANGVTGTAVFSSGNNLILSGNVSSDTITFAVNDNPTFTTVSATGNIYGGNLSVSGNIIGNFNLDNGVSATGNITGGNILTGGLVSATGNITGNYIFGNGAYLTNINAGNLVGAYGNSNVANYLNTGLVGNIIPAANVTYSLGNLTNQWASVYIGANTLYINSVPISITGANTLTVAGANVVTSSANGVISGNVISVTGNITGGNILSSGVISTSGNIFGGGVNSTSSATPPTNPSVGDFWYNTATNAQYRYTFDGTDYFWLDDFGSTQGTDGTFSAVINGTSNIGFATANGNAVFNINGTNNVAVVSSNLLQIAGSITATGNITASGLNIVLSNTPASSSSAGVAGQIEWDQNYLYVCVATNTWKRVAISTW